jgi:hypothetical protein
MNVRASPPR